MTVRSPSPRLIHQELPPPPEPKREPRKGLVSKPRPPPAPSENHTNHKASPRRHATTKVNSLMKEVYSETKTETSLKYDF